MDPRVGAFPTSYIKPVQISATGHPIPSYRPISRSHHVSLPTRTHRKGAIVAFCLFALSPI